MNEKLIALVDEIHKLAMEFAKEGQTEWADQYKEAEEYVWRAFRILYKF